MANLESRPIGTVICPGMHPLALTESFLQGLKLQDSKELSHLNTGERLQIFPAHDRPAYSTYHLLEFLQAVFPSTTALVFISFSAGVVGAIGAAKSWQRLGGTVAALIALDGWGVPLYGDFPIHRLSHDAFTDWSSAGWGGGKERFYADPAVDHLQLWRSPHTTDGYWITESVDGRVNSRTTTAANFLKALLVRYQPIA